MNLNVTQKQFDALERGQREAILVKNSRTRKEYAIIPQATFQKLQPLLKHAGQKNGSESEDLDSWTEVKNVRRAALVNKHHDDKLTRAEARELATLQAEIWRHQQRVSPVNNDVLELILEALQQRARREKNAGQ